MSASLLRDLRGARHISGAIGRQVLGVWTITFDAASLPILDPTNITEPKQTARLPGLSFEFN
jgi:hypothetical protein